jgi:hypothetical protein
MRADRHHPGRQPINGGHYLRGRNGRRPARWRSMAMTRLPGWQGRALDRIGHRAAAEDPGLGMRFAFFAILAGNEPIPATEQVPGRRQRFLRRRAVLLPLLAVSLVAVLAASLLIPGSPQSCPAGANRAAHTLSSLSHVAQCQPGPAIKLDPMPMH